MRKIFRNMGLIVRGRLTMGTLIVVVAVLLVGIPIGLRMLTRLALLGFIVGSIVLLVYETFSATAPSPRDRNRR